MVNGKPIKKIWVDTLMDDFKNANVTPDLRAIYSQLEDNEILVQEAQRLLLDKKPEYMIQEEMQARRLLVNMLAKEVEGNFKITDDMLKKEYEEYKLAIGVNEYNVRHIQLTTDAEAMAIIVDLSKGADFAKLAKEHSKDLKTRDNGGSLGWIKKNSITPEIGNILPKLQKGLFTTIPIKTRTGWSVVKLEDTRPMEVPTIEKTKDILQAGLRRAEIRRYLSSLRAKAVISRNPEAR
jgi:peptidyl-prolyl cis-trans isomerase C